MKTYTREELKNITAEQKSKMSAEQLNDIRGQGKAFAQAEADIYGIAP